MQMNSVALIVAIEVVAVLLLALTVLFFKNRSLKSLVEKLQKRMAQLVEDLRLARAEKARNPSPEPDPKPAKTYIDFINEALENTKAHHTSLDPDRDIVLDLAPDTPLHKRAAALRYAVMLAEKEANSSIEEGCEPDWSRIRAKYQQIFDFYEDYVPEPTAKTANEDIDALNQELVNAKKRINNLEKFKALYFDLEDEWENSKQKAQSSYDNLSALASDTKDAEKFEQALGSYHSAYKEVDRMIQVGIGDPETIVQPSKINDDETAGELRHLRSVAADQHKLITELQAKLKNAGTEAEREQIVESLKDELDRQKRFMHESETCIQLMEDELQNSHKELDQLKGRLKALPGIKTQLQDIQRQKDEYEIKVYALTSENRKLTKKLNDEQGATVMDSREVTNLKKELASLQSNYASLEEKYLDLKIKN